MKKYNLTHEPAKRNRNTDKYIRVGLYIIKAWVEALYEGLICPAKNSAPYVMFAEWAKEFVDASAKGNNWNLDEFIADKFSGAYYKGCSSSFDDSTLSVIMVSMYIMETYMCNLLYGIGIITQSDDDIDWDRRINAFASWAKTYNGTESYKKIEDYTYHMLAKQQNNG